MDLKTKFKNFFTLTPKANDGFTLVELIVVIAILAILGGVAVPAYSGYITKTNKQADMSLVSEIEHALTLAYYNQDLTDGDAGVMILMHGVAVDVGNLGIDSKTVSAMEKTFGSNWAEALQLKHDSWSAKNMTLSYEDAQAVVNSHFVQNYSSEDLMKQVQAMTDAVNGLQLQIGDTEVKLRDMYNYEDADGNTKNAIDDVIAEYNVEKSWDDMNEVEKSNLLVLATASSISKGQESGVSMVMPNYAQYTAFATENAEFNNAYKNFQNSIANVDPNSADSQYKQVKDAYNVLQDEANKNGFQTWKQTNGDVNSNAFNAIMSGVGNAMKDNSDAILSDLGNAEMFTSGVGSQMYNDYLDSAYAAAGGLADGGVGDMMSMAGDGIVVVGYTVANGQLYIDNSLPING